MQETIIFLLTGLQLNVVIKQNFFDFEKNHFYSLKSRLEGAALKT